MRKAGEYSSYGVFKQRFVTCMNDCGSNKSSAHNYENIYDFLFPPSFAVNNFLEIGVFVDELPRTSLTAWSSLFPNANIYGADIQEDRLFSHGKIQMHHLDQASDESLEAFKSSLSVEFDAIVDDGAHKHELTIATFEKLFPMLRDGGMYIIEDCHSDASYPHHTIAQLSEYFDDGGYDYEVFESSSTKHVVSVDETTKQPVFGEFDTPNHILCVYKK